VAARGPPPKGFGPQGGQASAGWRIAPTARLRNTVFSGLQSLSASQAAEPQVIANDFDK